MEARIRILALVYSVYSILPAPPNGKVNFQTNFPCLINLGQPLIYFKKPAKSLIFVHVSIGLENSPVLEQEVWEFPQVAQSICRNKGYTVASTFQKFPLLIIILNARNYQPEKMILQNKVRKKLGHFRVTFGIINLSKTGSNLEVCLAHYILLKPNQAFLGSYICTTS